MVAAISLSCSAPEPPPEVWELEPDYYLFHAVLGHVHKPNAVRETPVPQHPDGRVFFRTEGRGFRADDDITVPKPPDTWRLLVLGDSHVDGVVDNSESLATGLSMRLMVQARSVGFEGRVEVINGGTGHWGPTQYGAAPGVWAELEPDACLVVIYEGNDFLDVLAAEERAGRRTLIRKVDHFDKLLAAQDVVGEHVSQQLNQDLVMAADPAAASDAVALTLASLAQAAARCPLSVAVLPTAGSVQPPSAPQRAHIAQALGLSPSQRLSGRAVSKRLLTALEDQGVATLDTWSALYAGRHGLPGTDGVKSHPQRMFWTSDQHLSVDGHARVARAVAEAFGPGWWPADHADSQ